jgi:Right handed beta helix region
VIVTCAALAIALASPATVGPLYLSEDCASADKVRAAFTARQEYAKPLVIELGLHRIAGFTVLCLTGQPCGNIVLRGGFIEGPAGSGLVDGKSGGAVTGLSINPRAHDVTVEGVTFTNVRKAIVLWQARDVAVRFSRFTGELEDGLIARQSDGIIFSHNVVQDLKLRQSRCTLADGTVRESLSSRDCTVLGGAWRDGWHGDAIQFYDASDRVVVEFNRIITQGQGITTFGNSTTLPNGSAVVRWNYAATLANPITISREQTGAVQFNTIAEYPGGLKAVIRAPATMTRCGNIVPTYTGSVMRAHPGWEPCEGAN